jgi:hypothetical protein
MQIGRPQISFYLILGMANLGSKAREKGQNYKDLGLLPLSLTSNQAPHVKLKRAKRHQLGNLARAHIMSIKPLGVAVANSRKCETNYSRCSWNRESKKPKTFFLNLSSSAVVAQVACRLCACLLGLCHTTAPPCRHAATRAWLTTASMPCKKEVARRARRGCLLASRGIVRKNDYLPTTH